MAITPDRLAHALIQLAQALHAAGIPFAVAGAYALALHGHPRATRDIDVLTRAEFRSAADAVMTGLGYVPVGASAGFAQYERVTVPELPGLTERADFLFSSRALGARALAEASRHPLIWQGVALPVVPVGPLILMKLMAHCNDPRRPYDLGDARALLRSHRAVLDYDAMRRDADEIGADVRAALDRLFDESGTRDEGSVDGDFQLRI